MDLFKKHLDNLNERLLEVLSFIKVIENQKSLLAELDDERNKDIIDRLITLAQYKENIIPLVNSTVQYNAIIISIYGCFENYIDNIITEYLNEIFLITGKYDSLHENTKKKHLFNSAEFINNSQRYKNYDIKEDEVITNMYNCLKNNDAAKLSMPLLTHHSGNLGIEQIINLFNETGIENSAQLIKGNSIFIQNIMKTKEFDREDDTIEFLKKCKDSGFESLKSLISQRNSVSHSWIIENRLSLSILKEEIIPFIKILCECTYEILLCSYYNFKFVNNKLENFDKAIRIINNNILCINSKFSRLKVGDYLFYLDKNLHPHISQIEEIQCENKSIYQVLTDNTDIGIKLKNNVKREFVFFY